MINTKIEAYTKYLKKIQIRKQLILSVGLKENTREKISVLGLKYCLAKTMGKK